jgi:hypothetical protein
MREGELLSWQATIHFHLTWLTYYFFYESTVTTYQTNDFEMGTLTQVAGTSFNESKKSISALWSSD